MDPIRTYMGRLLLEEITPVVMVLTTPLVEESCQKNGLSFVNMLLPFSLFQKIDVPVRTASDQPYRLQMFKLRLFYSSEIQKQNHESIEGHLKQVVLEANEKSPPNLLSDPPQLETVLDKSESELCPPWIRIFNRELIRTLSFSDHETFDHPIACLLVVSSKDKQPINRFVDLFNTDQLPSILNEGVMDPKILKHYLLLHDNQDGPAERASGILVEMRSTFGSNDCKLLCINSWREADGNSNEVAWLPYKNQGLLDNGKTCCLNIDDLNEMKDFMQNLASNHIIPYIEQKIRVLNQQVSTTRKGFRNQIKNLWWRKGKDDPPEAPNGPMYTFSSIESQIRVLGDYAFMLRDYELALSNYRLLSTDYKLDKAWKRYAGVQEMSGLSYFMLDQSRKESEYCMENAFTTYLRVGSSAQRNATRCGLWWAEMLKARGQYREASTVYFRISNEEPTLHAAIMLEQASCCYLLSTPPMLRKYGFHLILAGNRYYISDQKQHAIRAYRNALFVYRENAWSFINNHVHFNIGRWYGSLGVLDVAIKHILEVLECSHQSLPTQNLFLNEFFHFVQSAGKTVDVHKLRLPTINMSSLRVVYEDHRTYASNSDVEVRESVWQDLEEEMIPSASGMRTNWLDSQPKPSPLNKYKDSCVCVAGEAVKVSLELKNPLQIPLPISDISLMCQLSEGSDTSSLDASVSSTAVVEPPVLRYIDEENSSFTLLKRDLVLGGGETKKIQLEVIPKVEGVLRIFGIRWTLSDSVVGYQYFEFNNTKNKNKKKAKKGAKHCLSDNLNLIVIKGVPKLEGYIEGLPAKAFAGELRLLTLKLRNISENSVKNIKMKISHPRYLIPGNPSDLDLDFPQCLEKKNTNLEDKKDNSTDTKDISKSLLFPFSSDVTVQAGETLFWPIWFHSGPSGNISLFISIYYEVQNSSSGMTYRTLRMYHSLQVLPSLDVYFVISPCKSELKEYLVRMDITNRTNSDSFLLQQLSCVGNNNDNKWAVSALPSCASITSVQTVLGGQALSCFFKLQDLRTGSSKKDENALEKSDLLIIGQEGSRDDALINISNSPLIDFHYQERYHQAKSAKGSSDSRVDFILISKVIESNSDFDSNSIAGPDGQLLSTHSCHCSVTNKNPIWWLMGGPHTIHHDFSSSFCEVNLHVDIHNCSPNPVNVRLATSDYPPDSNQSDPSIKQVGGWSDVSLANDIKIISSPHKIQSQKQLVESSPPFVWCGLSCAQASVGPRCTARVLLKICVFAPGTYNLSNYELHWEIEGGEIGGEERWSTGTGRGHPFYIAVLEGPK